MIDNVLWHGKVADPMVKYHCLPVTLTSNFLLSCHNFLIKTKHIILSKQVNDAKTVSIRNFNQRLTEDDRVSISMVSS